MWTVVCIFPAHFKILRDGQIVIWKLTVTDVILLTIKAKIVFVCVCVYLYIYVYILGRPKSSGFSIIHTYTYSERECT